MATTPVLTRRRPRMAVLACGGGGGTATPGSAPACDGKASNVSDLKKRRRRTAPPAHLTSAKEYRQSGKRVRKRCRENRGCHGDSRCQHFRSAPVRSVEENTCISRSLALPPLRAS